MWPKKQFFPIPYDGIPLLWIKMAWFFYEFGVAAEKGALGGYSEGVPSEESQRQKATYKNVDLTHRAMAFQPTMEAQSIFIGQYFLSHSQSQSHGTLTVHCMAY